MQTMEFGPYLKKLLKEKKISASELARMMAYKSRNTIFRILDGEGGHASRQAFYDRLVSENPLELSRQECAGLAAALEISRVGVSAYQDNLAMAALFFGENGCSDVSVRVIGGNGVQHGATLRALLEEYVQAQKLELEISGCCSRAVFDALSDVLLRSGHGCEVSVTHYVYTGAEEIIANIAAIQRMLFAPCYTAYSIRPDTYSAERERIYRSNCICAHVTNRDGSTYDEALILCDADCMIRFGRRHRGGFQLAESLFDDRRLKAYPIKSEFMLSSETQGLKEYIDECRRLEHNRAVYTVKLDIPFSFVHPDMLLEAAMEGFLETGFITRANMDEVIEGLYGIQLQRYENCFAKHRPTHTIFSRKAMEDFARTGRQSDHFFAMRPYTREERVRILTQIRDQARDNPNFFIYFFRDGVEPPCMEIALYEGVGVLLSKSFTDYDLGGDHAEAIIAQEDFCRCYKTYFFEDLLRHQTLSCEESIGVLEAIIAIAQQA